MVINNKVCASVWYHSSIFNMLFFRCAILSLHVSSWILLFIVFSLISLWGVRGNLRNRSHHGIIVKWSKPRRDRNQDSKKGGGDDSPVCQSYGLQRVGRMVGSRFRGLKPFPIQWYVFPCEPQTTLAKLAFAEATWAPPVGPVPVYFLTNPDYCYLYSFLNLLAYSW